MLDIDNKKSWYKKWWGIILILVLSLILIFVIVFGFYIFSIIKKVNSYDSKNLPLLSPSSLNYENKETIEGKNNYWFGSANPKITIVEFGDFSCPLCKNSFLKIHYKYQFYYTIYIYFLYEAVCPDGAWNASFPAKSF